MHTRDYKLSAPGEFFHIYNRGNAKENVFIDEDDFRFFLLRLRQNLVPDDRVNRHFRPITPNSFDLVSYCIMPNHFHLLIRQNTDIPTGKLMGKLCTSYGMYFNRKYDRVGHIFQDQFKQIHVDSNEYLTWLSAYIHSNPVMSGLVKKPEEWEWSSVDSFLNPDDDDKFIKPQIVLEQYKSPLEYREFLNKALNVKQGIIPSDILLDFD